MSTLVPRLSMAELDPKLQDALRPKVDRLKYLGEFFQCTGHQPQALMSFHKLTEDLKHALSDNLTEIVALTVACFMDNRYERVSTNACRSSSILAKRGFARWFRWRLKMEGSCPSQNG